MEKLFKYILIKYSLDTIVIYFSMNTLHTCTADGRTYLGISSLFHPALDINDPLSITTTLSDDILWRRNQENYNRKQTEDY